MHMCVYRCIYKCVYIHLHIYVLQLKMQDHEVEIQKYLFIFYKTHHNSSILSDRFTSGKMLDM